tara:strand:+ start:657 stop:3071 length:2415 start_codon:yes stop_codon:yes gene_type:complete
MAERIVSPGVFTREKDLSFLPQGVAEIGAAIVGPTLRGPAFTPTVVTSTSDLKKKFGPTGGTRPYYTSIAAERMLDNGAPSVTIVRVLGIGGYQVDALNLCEGTGPNNGRVLMTLVPSNKASAGTGDLSQSRISHVVNYASGSSNLASASLDVALFVSGSDVSLETIEGFRVDSGTNSIGVSAQDTNNSVYLYKDYNSEGNVLNPAPTASVSMSFHTLDLSGGSQTYSANGNAGTWTGNSSYSVARTPYIQSQKFGSARKNLFRVYTRGYGDDMNKNYHISIQNVKAANSANVAPGYAQFDLSVYLFDADANSYSEVETFSQCSLDPESNSYVVNKIGDGFETCDSQGNLTKYGAFGNKSDFIRIGDYSILPSLDKSTAPMGHSGVFNPGPGGINVPSASFHRSIDDASGNVDLGKFYGFDFNTANKLNQAYLSPIPATATEGANPTMSLEDMKGTSGGATGFADASTNLSLGSGTHVQQRRFKVPFQWGFDGENPARNIYFNGDIVSSNSQGFNLATSTDSGSVAYNQALGTIKDPDRIDINMIITPGIIHEYHPSVSNNAMSIAKSRGDAFYIMDGSRWGATVSQAVSNVSGIDNNYVATYFPWVSIQNPGGGGVIWVPPSVVMAGAYANNDSIGQEWFAPAGLNRGLIAAQDVKRILTHTERDELYDGRVNPIASFPGQGIVAFGQKTLQSRPSALDRVNVRRLLINLKKFIASSSRFLVFEQNTAATRNRFLNIVNPYMESVQQRSGLSAFRVVMDDTNNTPEVVDRNQLVGQIFVQPTRTAEFIVLDFVVLPTGAAFPE